jgi:hypothetical protein
MHLHDRLADDLNAWRADGYPCEEYDTVAEVLDWAHGSDGVNVRYLRMPHLRALEVYWYLRLVKRTPQVPDLYRGLFPRTTDCLKALGLGISSSLRRRPTRASTRCSSACRQTTHSYGGSSWRLSARR